MTLRDITAVTQNMLAPYGCCNNALICIEPRTRWALSAGWNTQAISTAFWGLSCIGERLLSVILLQVKWCLVFHTCETFSTTTRTSLVGCTGENDNKLAMLARMLVLFGKSQYRSRYDWLGARCILLLSFWQEPRLAFVEVVGTDESGERMPSSRGFSQLPSNCTVSAWLLPSLLVSLGMRTGTRNSRHVAKVENAPAA